jgi:diacylglycerol O-acyltransferase
MDLLAALFDVESAPAEPSPAASSAGSVSASEAGPHPSPLTLLMKAAIDSTKIATDMSAAILSRLRQPELALRDATWALAGLAGVAGKFVNSAPRSVLNIPVGSMRLVATVSRPLAEVKAVKSALGGTVNDVCLAAVAGALRTFLAERGDQSIEQPEAGRFRAMIPVSIRQGTGRQELGNKLVAMVAALPVDVGDARARLQAVRDTTARLKASPEQDGAAFLAAVEELAPPQVVAQASRLNFSSRLYNLMVTNIAGPQFPIYLLGRRVERIFPLGFLGMHHNLCVAILSYDGEINVGLLGDREAVPDIARVASHLEHAFDELRDAV